MPDEIGAKQRFPSEKGNFEPVFGFPERKIHEPLAEIRRAVQGIGLASAGHIAVTTGEVASLGKLKGESVSFQGHDKGLSL